MCLLLLFFVAHIASSQTLRGNVSTLTPLAEQRIINATEVALGSLTFNQPRGIAVDSTGTLIITDTSYIINISGSTAQLMAGQLGQFGFADGAATSEALLNAPTEVVVMGGSLYFTDAGNHAIRSLTNGQVATIAGSFPPTLASGFVDGTGAAARFNRPTCIVGDSSSGVLYVCDVNNARIRRVTTAGVVTTVGPIKAGNAMPNVRLTLFNSTLYIARQLQDTPQSAITTSPITGGDQLNFSTVPQSPAAAVVDSTSRFFVVTQDNRIGIVVVGGGTFQDVTGVPTTQVAADGQFPQTPPQTPPVFIQLVGIARAPAGDTYYSIEAGPSPRLRSIAIEDISPVIVTLFVPSVPPITNETALATLSTLVQGELSSFLQSFGLTGTSAPIGTTPTGNNFRASVPRSQADATVQRSALFASPGNPVADFVTAFNALRPLIVPFSTALPPRSLLTSQQAQLNGAYLSDVMGIVQDSRVTDVTSSLAGETLTLSANVPGSFLNASTQTALLPGSFSAMNAQLSNVNAVRTFDARIFDLTSAQLTTAGQRFASDVGNIANTDNVISSIPQVGSVATLTAGAPRFVLQPFQETISGLPLQSFPLLVSFLNTIRQSQAVAVVVPFFPTDPAERAAIVANITARAQTFAGSPDVTAEVVNATGGMATIVYRYPTTLNTLNFSNVDLTGIFALSPPGSVIPPGDSGSSRCPTVCIVIVTVFGSLLLLLLLLLLLWCCCKRERKSDELPVGQPQFQPVFQPNDGPADALEAQAQASVDASANPLYRTSELRESHRQDRDPAVSTEAVASSEERMLYHQLRDPVDPVVPVMSSAPMVAAAPAVPPSSERLDEVIRVLHVSPRREGSKSTRLPNPLVYDSVMRRLETQDAAPGTDSVIRVVKVVTRDSPSRSNRSASVSSRSKRHVRVDMSPNPHIPELADTAAPHTLTAVESALRQL